MNQTTTRRGPDARLLLLIPAVMIIAKAGRRRREMMADGWGGSPAAGRHGHHLFGAADRESGPRAFRLPPRLESALDAWHTRAHEAPNATEPEPELGTATI